MARKDWKKTGKNIWKKKDRTLIIYDSLNGTISYWNVQIGFYDKLSHYERHNFKTKKQALKFARSYMRKH